MINNVRGRPENDFPDNDHAIRVPETNTCFRTVVGRNHRLFRIYETVIHIGVYLLRDGGEFKPSWNKKKRKKEKKPFGKKRRERFSYGERDGTIKIISVIIHYHTY